MALAARLPEFAQPPVAEVALAISFHELPGFSVAHLGLAWQKFRNSYPRSEDHHPLALMIETPESEVPGKQQPQFQVLPKPTVRCWFLNTDGNQLIQIQSNAFVHNWRKQRDESYPRYDTVRESFVREFTAFSDFVSEFGLGEIRPNQCEVTYVNHIKTGTNTHASMGSVFRIWSDDRETAKETFLPPVEDGQATARYRINDDAGAFVGRLTVSLLPAYTLATKEEVLNFTLIARGRPLGTGIAGALSFFDLGHEWIVRGFTELTTERMHAEWKRNL